MDGGLITQRVTALLQIFGAVAAAFMLLNAIVVGRSSNRFGIVLAMAAIVLGVSIVGLFVVHSQLDAVIDVSAAEITDRERFTQLHRHYNQLTTVQWIASVAYLPITVIAWNKIDRNPHACVDDQS